MNLEQISPVSRSQMRWDMALLKALRGRQGPRVLTFPLLVRLASQFRPGIQESTVRHFLDSAIEHHFIRKVTRGVYLNTLCTPPAQLAEAATLIRQGAVVSLQSVLGEFGVSNNPASAVTCVLPLVRDGSKPSVGEIRTEGGLFTFHALPVSMFPPAAGPAYDLLLPDRPYPMFRPEKALLDRIYLGASRMSSMSPAPVDFDLDGLDLDLLDRIALRCGMQAQLKQYIDHREAMGRGEEPEEPTQRRRGPSR